MRQRGVTLYELLVTLILAAMLVGLALPSLSTLVARQRQRAEIDALFHAVHLARKESIMSRRVVSICPSPDGTRCSAGYDWSAGWLVFANHDRDEPPQIDSGEPVIQRHRAGDSVFITANRRGFTLRATEMRATNGTIVVCDRAGRVQPRALIVSYTGRPRVTVPGRADTRHNCRD